MGSLASEIDRTEKEIDIFVTGFGVRVPVSQASFPALMYETQPFGDNFTNPSYLIARSLPSKFEIPGLPLINIHVHPVPVTVTYRHVRDVIPRLIFTRDGEEQISRDSNNLYDPRKHAPGLMKRAKGKPKYDQVLNIGMAPGRRFYSLETCGHRDGYNRNDVDAKTLTGDTFWQDTYKSPEVLHTTFDTEDVWRRWKSCFPNEDVRSSNNAGHYLCDFTYYTSMVEYWRRDPGGKRPCMFLHVPGGYSADDVLKGREITLGLIAACVGSETTKRNLQEEYGNGDATATDFGDEGLS